jgi:hypothetical protein
MGLLAGLMAAFFRLTSNKLRRTSSIVFSTLIKQKVISGKIKNELLSEIGRIGYGSVNKINSSYINTGGSEETRS